MPDEALVRRISGRRACPQCGATYHVSMLGGRETCEKCGETLIQRADDQPETVLNRLRVYHSETAPLVSYYEAKGLLHRVNGEGDMDAIFAEIMKALQA